MHNRFLNNSWKCLCVCYLLISWTLYATWTTPVDVTLSPRDSREPQIATDAAGNVTAVWLRTFPGNNIVQASTKPIGGSWPITPDDLSLTGQDADNPQIAVDPNGNATAIWSLQDSDFIIQSSEQFIAPQVLSVNPNEGSVGTIVTLTGIGFITTTDVSFGVNPALSFVINSDSSITATAPPEALGTVNVIVTTSVGSSPAGVDNEFTYILLPPQNLKGKQKSNRFLSQEDPINALAWKVPTTGSNITQYKIYRDADLTDLIGVVAASNTFFQDHNRIKNAVYTYYIIATDDIGNTSTISSLVVYP